MDFCLKALDGNRLANRFKSEAFESILFGTDKWPSDMVDLDGLDIQREL